MLAQIGMNLELVYKAWEDLQFLHGWFYADWNPLEHCFLVHLFEPMLDMLQHLKRYHK